MAPEPTPPHPYPRPPATEAVRRVLPADLRLLLEGPEPPYLVDVRPTEELARARLPGANGIPFSELPRRAHELPRDRPIVLLCQFGGQSHRAAELLARRGFSDVAVLEGGLEAYSRTVDPTLPRYRDLKRDPFLFQQLPRPATGCLSYLLGDPVEHEAIILDPGQEVAPYLAALKAGGFALKAVLETHTHADHLGGHAALSERTGAPIFLSRRSPAQYPHRVLEEGEALPFGRHELKFRETPGHTLDHLTPHFADMAFTGDALLIGSCGRTDLTGGDPELLWQSLTEKILTLPDDTEVFPAHYGARHALPERFSSTIGFERQTNEALATGSLPAFRKYMTEGWPPKPSDFDRIVRANLEG